MVEPDVLQNHSIAFRVHDANSGGVKYRPEDRSEHGHRLSNVPLEHLPRAIDDYLGSHTDVGFTCGG